MKTKALSTLSVVIAIIDLLIALIHHDTITTICHTAITIVRLIS